MKRTLPAIMLILVCLSNGKHINTDYVFELIEKYKVLLYGSDTLHHREYYLTDEDIQNIKDAMGVYEKEEGVNDD